MWIRALIPVALVVTAACAASSKEVPRPTFASPAPPPPLPDPPQPQQKVFWPEPDHKGVPLIPAQLLGPLTNRAPFASFLKLLADRQDLCQRAEGKKKKSMSVEGKKVALKKVLEQCEYDHPRYFPFIPLLGHLQATLERGGMHTEWVTVEHGHEEYLTQRFQSSLIVRLPTAGYDRDAFYLVVRKWARDILIEPQENRHELSGGFEFITISGDRIDIAQLSSTDLPPHPNFTLFQTQDAVIIGFIY